MDHSHSLSCLYSTLTQTSLASYPTTTAFHQMPTAFHQMPTAFHQMPTARLLAMLRWLQLCDRMEHSLTVSEGKHLQLLHTLPSQLAIGWEEAQPEDSTLADRSVKSPTHGCCYDSFAFRDRMTNNRFQYRDARDQTLPLSFIEWTSSDNPASRELKNSLKVYKFTKNFEISCIRSKYLRQTHTNQQEHRPNPPRQSQNKPKQGLTRDALFHINKMEMRRVLETNDHVSGEVLRLNNSGCMGKEKVRRGVGRREVVRLQGVGQEEGEGQWRVTEKIINHMKHQIRNNGEYLLNLTLQQRRKALFATQLKRHKQIRRPPIPRHCHTEIQHCRFTVQPRMDERQGEKGEGRDCSEEGRQLLELVRSGFSNQAFLCLQEREELCWSRDQSGNNVFHLAAKEGNAHMAGTLLTVIPVRNCLSLLAETNHLKRTPRQKASLLAHREIIRIFDQFTHQHRQMI